MGWFKRLREGIQTTTKEKKEVPDGFWQKCNSCGGTYTILELEKEFFICPGCGNHFRIGSHDYFTILFGRRYKLLFENLKSSNFLDFTDLKSYDDRLQRAQEQTSLNDAISVGYGKVNRLPIVIAAMDFSFIGGSMGSVVGEKISRAIDYCIKEKTPLMIISKSGGARMMESAFSLMQLAKTSAKLALLAKNRIPYFSMLTDPTTGGVTASYAMLGDVNFSEPNALIGFAGPRVIKETIKRDLPEGFQRSEFLLEHGFLDFIVERNKLKDKVAELLRYFSN
jgi:acetyl-CoA carboxylase carboxyl transferase subunit beta